MLAPTWCGHGDSNPNASLHENLNLACLPIPSCPRILIYLTMIHKASAKVNEKENARTIFTVRAFSQLIKR